MTEGREGFFTHIRTRSQWGSPCGLSVTSAGCTVTCPKTSLAIVSPCLSSATLRGPVSTRWMRLPKAPTRGADMSPPMPPMPTTITSFGVFSGPAEILSLMGSRSKSVGRPTIEVGRDGCLLRAVGAWVPWQP